MKQSPFGSPVPTPVSEGFWQACNEGKLVVQTCTDCDSPQHPPLPHCRKCYGGNLEFRLSAGRGTVYSTSLVNRPPMVGIPVPYRVAIIEMKERWFILSNIVGAGAGLAKIGDEVRAGFLETESGQKIPVFRRILP